MMDDDDTEVRNVVHGNTGNAFQSGHLFNSNVTIGAPAETSADIYARGVEYLNHRVIPEARAAFEEARARGYSGHDITFHWLLSLLSGKMLLQLTDHDYAQLEAWLTNSGRMRGVDEWSNGVTFISQLLVPPVDEKPHSDPGTQHDCPAPVSFADLTHDQRTKIFTHLGLFLHGQIREELWLGAMERAHHLQCDGNRKERAWKFFHPDPTGPRVRRPEKPELAPASWAAVMAFTAVTAWAVFRLALLIGHGQTGYLVIAPLMAAIGACTSVIYGARWRARGEMIRDKDRATAKASDPTVNISSAGADGFTRQVENAIDRYFGRYVPRNISREEWLAHTQGVRQNLRSELAYIYRESRVPASSIAWLVRYRVGVVKQGWENGTLWDYRQQLKPSAHTVLLTLGGLGLLVLAGLRTFTAAADTSLIEAFALTVLVIGAGVPSAKRWINFLAAQERYEHDSVEADELYQACQAAYGRWKQKLADRPSDEEMANWLDYDRKVMLHNAMTWFNLAVTDLRSSAFLELPASRISGREGRGPRRYSRYMLHAFLITADGVRHVKSSLNLETAELAGQGRHIYGFDNLVEVEVTEKDGRPTQFELTLVNARKIDFPIVSTAPSMEPSPELVPSNGSALSVQGSLTVNQGGVDQEQSGVDAMTLAATGFSDALRLLEGIAAEGKQWIILEENRSRRRLQQLASALQ